MRRVHESVFRRLLCIVVVCALGLTACGKREEATSEAKEPARNEAPAKSTPGVVELGADAPELKQMSMEQVRTVPMPGDEVVAPAKIEANPNRIGHAVLPLPGRIVRVMVK